MNTAASNEKLPKKKSSLALLVGTLALLIALLAAAISVYSISQMRDIKSSAGKSGFLVAGQVSLLKDQISNLSNAQQQYTNSLTKLTQKIGNRYNLKGFSQIAYLVNIANLQLNVSHNVAATIHLLTLAQNKLEALDDPRLYALSKSIANNITALKAVPTLDLTALISQIDMLIGQLMNTSLLPNRNDLRQAEQNTAHAVGAKDTSQAKWYQHVWHHLSGLKELVIIRKSDPNIKPILDAEQRMSIKLAIQNKLLLAEFAAMQHNNNLFQQQLTEAKGLVQRYFFYSIGRDQLILKINGLKTTDVSHKLPNISGTLTILDQSRQHMLHGNAVPKAKTLPSLPTKAEEQPKPPAKKQAVPATNPGVAI